MLRIPYQGDVQKTLICTTTTSLRSLTASTSDNLGIPYQRKEADVQEDFIMYTTTTGYQITQGQPPLWEATQVATVTGKLNYVQQPQAIRSLRDSL